MTEPSLGEAGAFRHSFAATSGPRRALSAGLLLLSTTALAGISLLAATDQLTNGSTLAIGATAAAGAVALLLGGRKGAGQATATTRHIQPDQVIDRAQALIVVTDGMGQMLSYNKACAEFSGYSMAELADLRQWRALVPPDEWDSVLAAVDGSSGEAFPRVNENHWVTRSGEKRLLRWTCSDIRDASGHLAAIVAAGIDITDLRRSEALAQRSEMALRRAHRIAKLAYWNWLPTSHIGQRIGDDSEGQYSYAAEAAEIFEIPLSDLNQGDDPAYAALIHPEDRAAAMERYHALVKSDDDHLTQDYRICRANGSHRHIRVISEKLRDEHGHIIEMTGIIQDLTEIRRAELAIQQVQLILTAAHKLAGVGYWFWEEAGHQNDESKAPTTNFHYSAEAQAVSGISEGEMQALSTEEFCQRFIHGADRARVLETLLRFRRGEIDQYTIEYDYLHPLLGERTLRTVALRERDATGTALHATGMIHDISDMRRGEYALRDKEHQLETAHHLARLGYWSWLKDGTTPNGGIKTAIWSKEAAAITGIDVDTAEAAMLDFTFEQRFPHPDDRLRLMRAIEELRDGRRTGYDLDYRLRGPDGREIWLRSLAEQMVDAEGRVIGAFGVVQDISERKNAEADLRRAHQSLANAQRIAHVGNWSRVMATGEFICSDEVYRIFGFEPGGFAMTFERMLDIVHPEDRARLAKHIHETTEKPAPFQIEHRIILPGNEVRFVRQQGEPMLDSDGRLVRLEGIVLDITDIKAREKALNQARIRAETADRAKTEFLANMSHELRTPLNAVIGFSDVLAQQLLGPVPESYNESIEAIRTSGRHLLEIISDLLEMSRIESGERYLQEAPFDVRAAILACSQNFSNQAKRDGIALLIDNTGRLPTLLGEERAFKQILGNLLSNALKFTPRNGQVTITATTESDTGLLIAVSDTGKGIDPLLLPKLGKPFAQGESSLSRRYGGVGLGLAISRRLMDLHNGRLEITSAPDAVTRVIMIFPPERILSENTR
ncbi:PAS domain-containing protein [Dongia mobilis]|uniref:PAS domain-containing protein n=1 Tax=Dongia sp. TaxID=1977262 RepID=UPI0026EF891A